MYFLEGKEPLTELMFLILKVCAVSPKDAQKIKRNNQMGYHWNGSTNGRTSYLLILLSQTQCGKVL